jgi:hypothetical protein
LHNVLGSFQRTHQRVGEPNGSRILRSIELGELVITDNTLSVTDGRTLRIPHLERHPGEECVPDNEASEAIPLVLLITLDKSDVPGSRLQSSRDFFVGT